jgi:G3E family GTPase
MLSRPRQVNAVTGEFDVVGERDRAVFEGKTNLVVCPSHLVKQWADEIQKHSSLVVIPIAVINNLKKLTYQQILDADVVVVSHQFLVNESYAKKVAGCLETLQSRAKKLNIKPTKVTPVLQHIGW